MEKVKVIAKFVRISVIAENADPLYEFAKKEYPGYRTLLPISHVLFKAGETYEALSERKWFMLLEEKHNEQD